MYRKRLLISSCFFDACTTYISESICMQNYALIIKRSRYFNLFTHRHINISKISYRIPYHRSPGVLKDIDF